MWRSARLAAAVAEVEAQLDVAWAGLRAELGGGPDADLAALVLEAPQEHDWRVVDAALARSVCDGGHVLGAGPRGCAPCDLADGFRFGAREPDRPDVPPGNEHALRVASAVARTRERYTPRARAGYELLLPDLLAGHLPTTSEAQAGKAMINKLTPAECDRVTSLAEVADLVGGRA